MSTRRRLRALLLAAIMLATPLAAVAQNRGGPPPTAKVLAPIDLTGYWVSVVNEDWRYRMVTPAKGDYKGVPITQEALKIVNAWDPKADDAAGNQCKSYGAGAVMRVPGRISRDTKPLDIVSLFISRGRTGRWRQVAGMPHGPHSK